MGSHLQNKVQCVHPHHSRNMKGINVICTQCGVDQHRLNFKSKMVKGKMKAICQKCRQLDIRKEKLRESNSIKCKSSLRMIENPTRAESLLYDALKRNNIPVRPQVIMYGFILDFYMRKSRIAIEVDGGYHNEKSQKIYDEGRTNILNHRGIRVIRFTNEEIINDIDSVIRKIEVHKNSSKLPIEKSRTTKKKSNVNKIMVMLESGASVEDLTEAIREIVGYGKSQETAVLR